MASSSASPAPAPIRPSLADRDCSHVDPARAATFSNSRVPHNSQNNNANKNNSANNAPSNNNSNNNNTSKAALPRRGSFHNGRPLSVAARAAQDGYFARKAAAKVIAERRRVATAAAAAAAAAPDDPALAAAAAKAAAEAAKPPHHNKKDGGKRHSQQHAAKQSADKHKPQHAPPPSQPVSQPQQLNKHEPIIDTPDAKPSITRTSSVTRTSSLSRSSSISRTSSLSRSSSKQLVAPVAAADEDAAAPVSVINVTVDADGVRISEGNAPSRPLSRTNSRAAMSRSSSRSRNDLSVLRNPRPAGIGGDDKENLADGLAAAAAEGAMKSADGTFRRRRSVRDWKGSDAGSSADGGEKPWDGSMPRRQSSRSFIQKSASAEKTAELFAARKNAVSEVKDEHARRSKPQRCATAPSLPNKVLAESQIRNVMSVEEHADPVGLPTVQGDIKEKEDIKKEGANADDVDGKDGGDALKKSTAAVGTEMPPAPGAVARAHLPESCQHGAKETEQSAKQGVTIHTETSTVSHSSEVSETRSSDSADSKVPASGRWCDECAGVGLLITALLSEMESAGGALTDGRRDSSASPVKKGWKSIVLGDGKSKSSSERARLQQENNVLRATVDFLYKKIEQLEK